MRKQFHVLLREKKYWKFNSVMVVVTKDIVMSEILICTQSPHGGDEAMQCVPLTHAIFVPNNIKWVLHCRFYFLFYRHYCLTDCILIYLIPRSF